jgi:hypothetical protein
VQFRKCGLANLVLMHIMFGSAHVTGATASTPRNLYDDFSENEVHEVEDDVTLATLNKKNINSLRPPSTIVIEEKEEKSPFLRLYKRTCMKIEEGVDKINTSVEASSAPPVTTQVPSLAETMRMVKECGVKEKTALLHTATLLIMKPKGREVLKVDLISRRGNVRRSYEYFCYGVCVEQYFCYGVCVKQYFCYGICVEQ